MSKLFTKPTYFELNGEVASAIPTSDGGVEITKPTSMYFAEFLQDGSEITKVAYDKLHKKALIKYEQNMEKINLLSLQQLLKGRKWEELTEQEQLEISQQVANQFLCSPFQGKAAKELKARVVLPSKLNKKQAQQDGESEIVFVPNLVQNTLTQCQIWKVSEESLFSLCNNLLEIIEVMESDSHNIWSIERCSECGQYYSYYWHKEVDWVNGEDPTSWTYFPITPEQATGLINGTPFEKSEYAYHIEGQWPSGQEISVRWKKN